MQVRGLRVETITAILRTRGERGKFQSIEDFVRRVRVDRGEIESLIKCGAFDEMNDESWTMTRPEMLWGWNLLQADKGAHARASGPMGIGQAFLPVDFLTEEKNGQTRMSVPQYTIETNQRCERGVLEAGVSGHP